MQQVPIGETGEVPADRGLFVLVAALLGMAVQFEFIVHLFYWSSRGLDKLV